MSTIYVVERVYSLFGQAKAYLPIKAYRVEAEANGKVTKFREEYPERTYRVLKLELVED